MKTIKAVSLFGSIILAALVLAACSPAGTVSPEKATAPVQETFSDPFAYCAAVGQIDAPDARYTGSQMPDSLFTSYLKAAGLDTNANIPETFKQMTIWRCMESKVYACNFGANIPCDSKANTDKTPTQEMIDYCKEFPRADFIPMSVTGHDVIFSWHCEEDTPEILEQIGTVDAAGYIANFWQRVEPAP